VVPASVSYGIIVASQSVHLLVINLTEASTAIFTTVPNKVLKYKSATQRLMSEVVMPES
jgi:hypothetical protein